MVGLTWMVFINRATSTLSSCQAQTKIVVPDFTECAVTSPVIVVCPILRPGESGRERPETKNYLVRVVFETL